MESSGSISYDLPWFDYGDYYTIRNGEVLLYPADNENNTKILFEITALSDDSINVYCHKDSRIYSLYRQE